MNDNFEKTAKSARIIFPVIGIAMLAVGLIRFFAAGDYIGLGESGVMGLFVIAVGYVLSPVLRHFAQKESEQASAEEMHDQGL